MTPNKKVLVKDLNPYLTCTLCGGYFIDATALVDCLHVFCRGCILRYFENCKQGCPNCNTVYKKKNTTFFKPDTQLQTLVYKLVPGLYSKEMQRREDFYRTTGDRAGSSCSDDSVLGDMAQDHEEWISSYVGDNNQFYSPEDSISLSLEYYQAQLDTTAVNSTTKVKNSDNKDGESEAKKDVDVSGAGDSDEHLLKNDRRYLQCPAAVTMSHLQKFVRMKFGLTSEHKVDIIYAGEVLPQHFTLMDVAYTFRWSRTKPMRFFYRIFVFTPMKVVRPIKIITTSSSNGKQLQIVPVKPGVGAVKPEVDAAKPNIVPVTPLPQNNKPQESEENYTKKEKLLANLQLWSKDRLEQQQQQQQQQKQKQKKKEEESCVYEYEEPDKEEIKRFAEKRDREWALQKHLDEQQEETRHVSKKRKKNKHSKNESVHKKRKLHAEITSNEVLTKEESLKLKVKLTPHNGHKHKHHKQAVIEPIKPPPPPPPPPPLVQEQSSKEKLLQMRAVRHKHVNNDEKTVPAEKPQVEKPVQSVEVPTKKETPPPPPPPPEKPPRSDITVKTSTSKEMAPNEQTRKVTILKTFQSHPEKSNNNNNNKVQEKVVPPVKIETKKPQILNSKLLERKIANLKQQCTIGPKKDNTKLVLIGEKQQYNTGFTVSKIEAGVKRKAPESEEARDKRPSLEITLINPSSNKAEETKTKRPPPATIPLERIKKSISFKSGISIIPKLPERCDNIGALDLSKPSTTHNGVTVTTAAKINNCVAKKPPEKTAAAAVHMSNLQMLSKVALEHPTLNKQQQQGGSGSKPKLPNLQTLKTPTPPAQQKSLPKLNEINKTQFRLVNSQVRNMRPNQSQNVRNIPNPSLLVRQQTQNRLNSSISQNGGGNGDGPKEPPPVPPSQPKTNVTVAATVATTTAVTTATATETAKQ